MSEVFKTDGIVVAGFSITLRSFWNKTDQNILYLAFSAHCLNDIILIFMTMFAEFYVVMDLKKSL